MIAGREKVGYIELRWAPKGQSMRQEFFPVANIHAAADFANRVAARADVFVGAAPRVEREGGKRAVERSWCLWVDCDTPDSVEKLRAFTPAPTMIVRSGSGENVHAWWSLIQSVPARMAEQANRRLAYHLGADARCAEVARILRPPGTFNHKHEPPGIVSCDGGTGALVRPVEMVANLPDPPHAGKQGKPAPRRRATRDALRGISAQEYVPRLTGRDVDFKGYVQCPFHEDWNPSLMAYADPKRGWYCFQCGAGGDVYSFGSALWEIPVRGRGFVALRERLERELL